MKKLGHKAAEFKSLFVFLAIVGSMFCAGTLFAGDAGGGGEVKTIGDVAAGITASFASLTSLITGGCYIAGLAFAVTAILQFKQHKDNPTQITIGKPISLVFIAAALLFMPSVLKVAGYSMFGSGADVAGSAGKEFNPKGGGGGAGG